MGSFAQSGRTVLFVSHNLDAVRSLSQVGVWFKDGHIAMTGKAGEVIDAYLSSISQENPFSYTNADYGLAIEKVTLKNEMGEVCNVFAPGEDLTVEICYTAQKKVEKPIFAIGVIGANGPCFTSNMLLDGFQPDYIDGRGRIQCTFRSIPLLPQDFSIKMRVQIGETRETVIPYQDVAYFSVAADLADYGYKGESWRWARYSTPVVVPYEWRFADGRTASVALERTPQLAAGSRRHSEPD